MDAIDDHTLRIVGTRASWRPIEDYAGLWPTPSHATVLDADWVKRTNNQFQIAPGPYVIAEAVRGQSITFGGVPNWWGDGKKRFQGLFNFDRIVCAQIPSERRLDWLRRGELDLMQAGLCARAGTRNTPSPPCATAGSSARECSAAARRASMACT